MTHGRFHTLLMLTGALVIGAVSIAFAVGGRQAASPEALLGRAQHQQDVESDFNAAIATYKQVIASPKAPRALVARALLLMGACYEQLGNVEAKRAYERIIREFSDLGDTASAARGRLADLNAGTRAGGGDPAAIAGNAGMVNLQRWTGPKVDIAGTVSPDGRYLSFVDWDTGDLALHDLTTGLDRRLTRKGTWAESSDFAEVNAISRDGTQVAYGWYNDATARYELRTLKLETASPSTARTLYANADVIYIAPFDWSPDGKWLAVEVVRNDHTRQFGVLATNDGTLKILKSPVDMRGPTKMVFSPDGTLIAYDLRVDDTSGQRDVFVMSFDGTRDAAATPHPAFDTVMGWAPDGSALLFASERSGSLALWSLPMANGKPAATPALVKSDLGPEAVGLGVTRAGGLVYAIRTSAQSIQTAEIDFSTGKVLSPPTKAVESYLHSDSQPDWSRDGKSLVYKSERSRNLQTLSILSLGNGQVRELRPPMDYPWRPLWAPDGSITVEGADRGGRSGIYRVDAQAGDLSPIVVDGPGVKSNLASWSPDGKLLAYRRVGADDQAIVIREMPSGRERELVRATFLYAVSLSPDGQQVAYVAVDPPRTAATLNVMSVQGGPARELIRLPEPMGLVGLAEWTPDGRLVFGKWKRSENTSPTASLWIVSPTGGTPTELEFSLPFGVRSRLRVHPDGRHVAFSSSVNNSWEVWTLEHFLPNTTTIKK